MAEKKLNIRLINKHDIEANWLKATNFIPKKAEIIVYDRDDNVADESLRGTYSYARFKIGDGETPVSALPFRDVPEAPGANMYLVTDNDGDLVWVEKPTAVDVDADPAGTAVSKVSEHNNDASAHNDIREAFQNMAALVETALGTNGFLVDAEGNATFKANAWPYAEEVAY